MIISRIRLLYVIKTMYIHTKKTRSSNFCHISNECVCVCVCGECENYMRLQRLIRRQDDGGAHICTFSRYYLPRAARSPTFGGHQTYTTHSELYIGRNGTSIKIYFHSKPNFQRGARRFSPIFLFPSFLRGGGIAVSLNTYE
jgi:hypothetical protein